MLNDSVFRLQIVLAVVLIGFTSARTLTFMEALHYPLTIMACQNYKESLMLDGVISASNVYYERRMIVEVLRSILGSSVDITFTCVESFEQDDVDDTSHAFSGKFGSNSVFTLANSAYYTSLPTIHFSQFFVERKNLSTPISQSIFSYLNYLFYLGIFGIPAIVGIVLLLLLKNLDSFYDYQGVVYSVFRYLNRQGDQQMRLWLQKILALTIAVFFFFHYSVLQSEMTAFRMGLFAISLKNRDSYREVTPSFSLQQNIAYLKVNSVQMVYLKDDYEVNGMIKQDTDDNHYNLLLNKDHFTAIEYNQIKIAMLKYDAGLPTTDNPNEDLKTYDLGSAISVITRNNDIYLNWVIVIVGVCIGLVFHVFQKKVSSHTEVKKFRERCNGLIQQEVSLMVADEMQESVERMSAYNSTENFRKLIISKLHKSISRQIFRVVMRRRRKSFKHHKKKEMNFAAQDDSESVNSQINQPQQKQSSQGDEQRNKSLYETIKRRIETQKKYKAATRVIQDIYQSKYNKQLTAMKSEFNTIVSERQQLKTEPDQQQQIQPSSQITIPSPKKEVYYRARRSENFTVRLRESGIELTEQWFAQLEGRNEKQPGEDGEGASIILQSQRSRVELDNVSAPLHTHDLAKSKSADNLDEGTAQKVATTNWFCALSDLNKDLKINAKDSTDAYSQSQNQEGQVTISFQHTEEDQQQGEHHVQILFTETDELHPKYLV